MFECFWVCFSASAAALNVEIQSKNKTGNCHLRWQLGFSHGVYFWSLFWNCCWDILKILQVIWGLYHDPVQRRAHQQVSQSFHAICDLWPQGRGWGHPHLIFLKSDLSKDLPLIWAFYHIPVQRNVRFNTVFMLYVTFDPKVGIKVIEISFFTDWS